MMKLFDRFKMLDHGVPVPLKIPTKSIIKDVFKHYWKIYLAIAIFTIVSYACVVGIKPVEMPKDEVLKQVQACSDRGKRSLIRYTDEFKPIYVRCK
jgi:hypothetical protein